MTLGVYGFALAQELSWCGRILMRQVSGLTIAFRRSIELNPSMDAFHEGLAEALVKSGDLNGAESEYRAAPL